MFPKILDFFWARLDGARTAFADSIEFGLVAKSPSVRETFIFLYCDVLVDVSLELVFVKEY